MSFSRAQSSASVEVACRPVFNPSEIAGWTQHTTMRPSAPSTHGMLRRRSAADHCRAPRVSNQRRLPIRCRAMPKPVPVASKSMVEGSGTALNLEGHIVVVTSAGVDAIARSPLYVRSGGEQVACKITDPLGTIHKQIGGTESRIVTEIRTSGRRLHLPRSQTSGSGHRFRHPNAPPGHHPVVRRKTLRISRCRCCKSW